MDRELVEYLQGMEQRITEQFTGVNARMDSLERRLDSLERRMDSLEQRSVATAELVSSVSESLQREMHAGFERIENRLEATETRLDRHGSLLQTGARWTLRMATGSERVDKGNIEHDKRIGMLEERIFKIDERRPPAPNEGA